MRPDIACGLAVALAAWVADSATAGIVANQTVITQNNQLSVDASPVDRRLAMELRGGVWLLPARGGPARLLTEPLLPARQPRWSPDGREILFLSAAGRVSRVWRVDVESGATSRVNNGEHYDKDATWHPGGQRVTFSSNRRGTGFDLWETDLKTGLSWRISNHPGDESQPAWASDGRDLAYISKAGDLWSLMLRRFGEADRELVSSTSMLAAPSWRPDGTLLTYIQETPAGRSLQMVILSEPPLTRQLARPDTYSLTPVSWPDRNRLFYAAGGRIKTRGFDEWSPRTVAFRATVDAPTPGPAIEIANRKLPLATPGEENLVIRSDRVFDGLSHRYRNNLDVRIQDGLIVEITPRREWPDATIIELGNTTLLPGLIDAFSTLPGADVANAGADLLSWGVTTLVSPDAIPTEAALWDTGQRPGPRLLRARRLQDEAGTEGAASDADVYLWTVAPQVDGPEVIKQALIEAVAAKQQEGSPVMAENGSLGLRVGAGLVLGTDLLPPLSTGDPLLDPPLTEGTGPVGVVSGLAGSGTPGLAALFASRQAARYGGLPILRQPATAPDLRGSGSQLVAGSLPNGLPAGLGLHAELRALAAAGLAGDQVLKAAGANAARILGLSGQLGEIAPGARADLVLVAGDPLANIADLQNIVAVVRNGRFYSLIALLETSAEGVE